MDYVVRGQGENALLELLAAVFAEDEAGLDSIAGLTWRRGGTVVHNRDRTFSTGPLALSLPYERLENRRNTWGRPTSGVARRATRRP